MRRRAVIVGYCALLMCSGCAWLRPREDRLLSSSSQTALGRHLSQSAQAAIDRQDYVRARDDLERLVAGSPRSAEAHHRLGRVMQLQGEWAEAAASYRRALEIDPEYVAALIGQGEVEAQLGRHDSALQRLDDAIEIDPHQAEAHLAEGRVLEAQGKIDEALAAYFRSLELEPNSPAVSLRVATLQLARKQTDQALARLDQVIEMAPDDPEAHHQRGLAHLALKHPSRAVADLRFAAEHLQNRPEVFYHLALALNADHKTADALQATERALKLAPEYADARNLSTQLRR
jgi:tetratricopeptide (TPR) repeat protein